MARGLFLNLEKLDGGIRRKLSDGVEAQVFFGDAVMVSRVVCQPGAKGKLHAHPEEQWGVLLQGSGIRVQDGERFAVRQGDLWQTPSNVEHTFEAGPEGAVILDIFSPPREEYRVAGEGYGKGVKG